MTAPDAPVGRPRLARSTIGRILIVIGVVGVVLSAVGAIVGWQLVAQAETTAEDSIVLTGEALDSLSDTIEVAREIIGTVQDGLVTIESSLGTVQTAFDDAVAVLGVVEESTGTALPETIEAVSGVLPTVASVAGTIDGALRLLSRVPFGPNYDPEVAFDESIRQLADAIAPLPEQLRTLSEGMSTITADSALVSAQITTLVEQLGELNAQLDETVPLLDRYAATATAARDVAARSRDDLSSSANATKWLVLLLGLLFAGAQVTPIWLGLELRREERDDAVDRVA